MKRVLLTLTIALLTLTIAMLSGSLLSSSSAIAQLLPPAKKAARVQITEGPALELSNGYLTIIRWTTNNPGGSDEHFGVVQYGTDPKNLNEMAKSHIRLNRGHSDTVFRVRLGALKPKTTYYYKVTSIESNGKSDGEESAVNRFTTPGPGEVIATSPPQPAPQAK
jgi:phosphodiesterase/alkaline phosphatase D-like protein